MKLKRRTVEKNCLAGVCAALMTAVFICGCGAKEEAGTDGPAPTEAAGEAVTEAAEETGAGGQEAAEAWAEAVEEAWAEEDSADASSPFVTSQDQIPEEVYHLLEDAVRKAADENEAFATGKDNFMIRTEFGPREAYESILLTRRDADDHSGMDTMNSLGLVYESSLKEYVDDQDEPWEEQEIWYLAYIRELVIGPEGTVEADPAGIETRIFDSYEDLYQWYVGDNEAAYACELRAWEGTV